MIFYFSQLKDKMILDSESRAVGKLEDLAVKDGEKFAEVQFLIFSKGKERLKIPAIIVAGYEDEITLSKKVIEITPLALDGTEILIKELILDRQLIDINGLKVVRVNDIVLADINGGLTVVSVDASMQGFMRRLGMPVFGKESNLIPWEYVEPIQTESQLRLKIPRQRVSSLHPADIADLLEELSPKQRASVFGRLDEEVAADTLAETEPRIARSMVADIKEKKIASVLEKMGPDEAADILSALQIGKAKEIAKFLTKEFAQKVNDLLGYQEQSAGRMMNPEFIAINQRFTAQQVIEYLRKLSPKSENIYYVYVIDDDKRLVGVLSLRELIVSPPDTKASDFMFQNVIKVSDKASKEEAAQLIVKFNLSVLPVVDSRDNLLGVITMENVITGVLPKTWKRIRPKRKYYLKKRAKKAANG